jgi:hypothetical protein
MVSKSQRMLGAVGSFGFRLGLYFGQTFLVLIPLLERGVRFYFSFFYIPTTWIPL